MQQHIRDTLTLITRIKMRLPVHGSHPPLIVLLYLNSDKINVRTNTTVVTPSDSVSLPNNYSYCDCTWEHCHKKFHTLHRFCGKEISCMKALY